AHLTSAPAPPVTVAPVDAGTSASPTPSEPTKIQEKQP
ncbi:twin-arginine translocase subunit TatB, partial [Xanthomonas oryzae pv. oryzae]